jgi:hypothetical protein
VLKGRLLYYFILRSKENPIKNNPLFMHSDITPITNGFTKKRLKILKQKENFTKISHLILKRNFFAPPQFLPFFCFGAA